MRIFALLVLCTGCSFAPLCVRSEYLSPKHLASSHINTPDPLRESFQGQQIVIHWNAPQLRKSTCKELVLTLQYGNLTQEQLVFEITSSRGSHVHYLLNQEYCTKQGITSYKVELFGDSILLSCWEHHLWSELIFIPDGVKPTPSGVEYKRPL